MAQRKPQTMGQQKQQNCEKEKHLSSPQMVAELEMVTERIAELEAQLINFQRLESSEGMSDERKLMYRIGLSYSAEKIRQSANKILEEIKSLCNIEEVFRPEYKSVVKQMN